jgi:astacin
MFRYASLIFLFVAHPAAAQDFVETGTTVYRGRVVRYEVVDGRAMVEGDIDLGPVETLAPDSVPKGVSSASFRFPPEYRWPNGAVPYLIDPDLPNPERILQAIGNWESRTPVRFPPRTTEPDYVRFRRYPNSGVCSATVGRAGGEQFVRLDDSCGVLATSHELGHAIGLYHEHARADRDYYIRINYENLDWRRQSDYGMHGTAGADIGPYDYGSIMHYTRFHSNVDRGLVTIETIPAGIPIDENLHDISALDVDAVQRMYGPAPVLTTITTNPPGLELIVDGITVTAPQSFDWAPGSIHTLEAPDLQGDGTPTRYVFGRWSDHGERIHTTIASPDRTAYSANFIRQYLVKTSVTPAGSGTATIWPESPDGYYTDGSRVTITATPAEGYSFLNFQGTGNVFYRFYHGRGNPSPSFVVDVAGLSYRANFTKSPYLTVTTDPPDLRITMNGAQECGPRNFDVSPGGTVTVSAPANIYLGDHEATRYVFVGWSDGGAATHTITAPASGPMPTVTARYRLQHLVTIAVEGRGTVTATPVSSDGYYDHGAAIELRAAPATGYLFARWEVDLSGQAATQTIRADRVLYARAVFAQPFTLSLADVRNAASLLYSAVSPGSAVTLLGLQLGPAAAATAKPDASGQYPTTLSGTQVLFDGIAASLLSAAPERITALAPYQVAGKATTSVRVVRDGRQTSAITVPVAASSPAIYTVDGSGYGQAAALNDDGTANSSVNPAARGSTITLTVTGVGQTIPPGVNGQVASSANLPVAAAPVTVRIGGPRGVGADARVLYAGAEEGLVAGIMRVKAIIPLDAPTGNVPVSVAVGDGPDSVEITTVAIRQP